MRWLSPPDSVPELRDRLRYSSPTSLREAQPFADFLEDTYCDLVLLGIHVVRQDVEPVARNPDRHLRDFADMQLVDLDGECLRLQAKTVAGRAGGRRHVALDFLARPGTVGLLPAPLQIGHDALEILGGVVRAGAVLIMEADLFLGPLQDRMPRLVGKIGPFARQLEAEGFSERFERLVIIG